MRELAIPREIEMALDAGGALALSISGGKDSQALTNALAPAALARGWDVFCLHMDLGRAEWPQTPEHVERIAQEHDLPLVVVRRPQGDLVQEIQDRQAKLTGTGRPFWPSASARYCTADQKRSQADKVYRNLADVAESHEQKTGRPFWPSASARYCTAHQKTNQADKVYRNYQVIVSAEGIRALESGARKRKPRMQVRRQITAKALRDLSVEDALAYQSLNQRVGITWYPIFDWTIDDVWAAMGTSANDLASRRQLYMEGHEEEALAGWPAHPAYVFGNERVSCALCVLANDGDIRNGAKHHPALYQTYRQMEIESGFTFKNGRSLADIVEGD